MAAPSVDRANAAKHKVLFIAPLPPPVNGQSLASQVFLNELKQHCDVTVVNSAKSRPRSFTDHLARVVDVVKLLSEIRARTKAVDAVYLTISESLLGNLKDLVTYLLCWSVLNKMTIHLHGGAGMAGIMNGNWSILRHVNSFFLRRVRKIILLGDTHRGIFHKCCDPERVCVVPNFAEDYLFCTRAEIQQKFSETNPIRLLFLSNLIPGKGHHELLDAFLSLDESVRAKLHLHFAGAFKCDADQVSFLQRISRCSNITYHGVVGGLAKQDLFRRSHLFCLPTYYPYEGQPISILEAYASGCAVMTTNHSGIRDVFSNGVNGFEVAKRSPDAIRELLCRIVEERDRLHAFALHNNAEALRKYRTSIYNSSLVAIVCPDHPLRSVVTKVA